MDTKNIKIHLDSPRRVWHPGDIVSGKVELITTEQVDVEKVNIRLEGRAKVKVVRRQNKNTHTYRSRIIFFVFESTLFKGPFTLKPGTLEWPFAFDIPEQCSNNPRAFGSNVLQYPPGFKLDQSASLTLPPTVTSYDEDPFSSSKSCYVSYGLLAKLHVASSFRWDRDQFLSINLQPYREQIVPDDVVYSDVIRKITIRSLHLDPEVGKRSLTLKERWKSTFSSDEIPKSCFSIRVELPKSGIAGMPAKAMLRLVYDHKESTAPEVPQILLTDATYSIREQVAAVVQAFHVFDDNDDGYTWEVKRTFCEWKGRKAFEKCEDGNFIFRQDLRAPTSTPSFGTLNIHWTYILKAKFTIECAGESEKFEAQVPFTCLPADFRESALETASVVEGDRRGDGEEQLPAYSKT